MKDCSIKYLIIPDIHGRFFWKEPFNKIINDTDAKIVFLGDYLDPYYDDFFYEDNNDPEVIDSPRYEEIPTMRDMYNHCVSMFQEIIELKKQYPDRIILLLGNHDCGYMFGSNWCDCRTDRLNRYKISDLFNSNRELFQLAYEDTINDKHFIFSHAGINKQYAHDCFGDKVNENNVVTLFNESYREDNYGIMDSLKKYSYWRGSGRNYYGSLIWADAREWWQGEQEAFGFSIIGHTQLKEYRIIENMAFLDSRQCFILKDNGEIETFE